MGHVHGITLRKRVQKNSYHSFVHHRSKGESKMVKMSNSYLENQVRAREAFFRSHPERIKTKAEQLEEGFVKDAFKMLNLVGNELILDLGAGNCWASQYMAELGCRVVAFDYNISDVQGLRAGRKLIEEGKSPYFDIVCGDWKKLPFKAEVFDVIFCYQSLHHSITLDNLVCDLYALLKRGGAMINIGDPTAPLYIMDRERYAKKHQTISIQGGVYDNYYSVRKYLGAYRRAGFSIQVITTASQPLDFLKSKRLGIVSRLWTQMETSDFRRLINKLLQPASLCLMSQSLIIMGLKK